MTPKERSDFRELVRHLAHLFEVGETAATSDIEMLRTWFDGEPVVYDDAAGSLLPIYVQEPGRADKTIQLAGTLHDTRLKEEVVSYLSSLGISPEAVLDVEIRVMDGLRQWRVVVISFEALELSE